MSTNIYIKQYFTSEINRREAMRYAGVSKPDAALDELLDSVIAEVGTQLPGKCVYTVIDPKLDGGELIDRMKRSSSDFRKYAQRAELYCIIVCTAGYTLDRLIARFNLISPARALMINAYGAERVERVADALCDEIAMQYSRDGYTAKPRFSPGYGDLSLEFQRDIFALLDPPSRIGVSLGDSLIMTPSKSISAIVALVRE